MVMRSKRTDKELAMRTKEAAHVSEFEWGSERTLSEAVIDAVATAAGVDALQLDPLYESVDPDALDTIFMPEASGRLREGDASVAFTVSGYDIVVKSYGRIIVYEADEGRVSDDLPVHHW